MYVWLLTLSLLCSLFYWYLKRERDFWKRRNVPHPEGKLFVGNMGPVLTMSTSMTQLYDQIYRDFKGYKYCGVLNFGKPAIILIDPDLIKDILVKDFAKFHDNLFVADEKRDPILSKNPFFARGEQWKLTRNQLSPQFTAAKVKKMFPIIAEVCQTLTAYLERESKAELNAKDFAANFTTDVVASCAFGLDARSLVDPKSEFREMGRKIMQSSTSDTMLMFLMLIFPSLEKYFAPKFLKDDTAKWFTTIILDTIKHREENSIKRDDFLDVIKELKEKTTEFDYTTDYMVAHALSFFLDGFETSSTVLQFAMFELGANPQVQHKLKLEIDEVLSKNGGNLTFEAIQEMAYLDMVFMENLRKYPPLMAMLKVCTESMKLPAQMKGGNEVVVEKGMTMIVPVMGIHYDPKYYPDPDRFDPERFSKENRDTLPKGTYLPFGDGPRICLGQRFATTQIKAAIITIVSNFEIRVNERTKLPLVFDPKEFFPTVVGGIWINFYKRKTI